MRWSRLGLAVVVRSEMVLEVDVERGGEGSGRRRLMFKFLSSRESSPAASSDMRVYKGQQLMWIASHLLPLAQVIKSLSALGMAAL